MVPGQDLQADGRPSTSPAGMLTAGLPLRFEGAVSAALFMMAREKPSSWMRSAPGMVDGGGPFGGKGDIGIGGAHDEVGRGEEIGHRLVELTPVRLDGSRLLQRVPVHGRPESGLHLPRQFVDADRDRRPPDRRRSRPVRPWPTGHEAAGGPGSTSTILSPALRARSSAMRRHLVGHFAAHPGDPEVGEDRHRPPGQIEATEARLPPADHGAGSADRADRNRCSSRSSGPCPAPSGSGNR